MNKYLMNTVLHCSLSPDKIPSLTIRLLDLLFQRIFSENFFFSINVLYDVMPSNFKCLLLNFDRREIIILVTFYFKATFFASIRII